MDKKKNVLMEDDISVSSTPNNARFVEAIYSDSGSIVFRSTNDEKKNVSINDLQFLLK